MHPAEVCVIAALWSRMRVFLMPWRLLRGGTRLVFGVRDSKTNGMVLLLLA